jgi:gas vesicle protein
MYKLRYVAVALVAGTVGAAVALLLAPDTGRNTRRKVMRRLQREREMLVRQGREMAEEAGEYVEARLKDGRKIVGRVVEEAQDRERTRGTELQIRQHGSGRTGPEYEHTMAEPSLRAAREPRQTRHQAPERNDAEGVNEGQTPQAERRMHVADRQEVLGLVHIYIFASDHGPEGAVGAAEQGFSVALSADGNTAIGSEALSSNTNGSGNTATGTGALALSNGDNNTANGGGALLSDTTGGGNTAIGRNALTVNTTGAGNTAVGWNALSNNVSGSGNIALGGSAGSNVASAGNVISIGSPGADVADSCYIGNIWQQPGGSQAVFVNASGKLGAQVSSRRFKDEIRPMDQASEAIYRLKPVSFRYKQEIEPARPLVFGLIAEEVEEVNSDLVARDKQGKPFSVRYDQVNAMVLNEFLKEHRTVQNQGTVIAQQQKEINDLKLELKEQKALIEKVNARVNTAVPQVVVDKL